MTFHRTQSRLAAGLFAAALVFAACSGSSATTAPASSAATSAAAATTAPGATAAASSGASAGSSITCDTTAKDPGVTDTEILLGATMPLSGSAAAGGTGAAEGEQAYFDMVNKAGGVQGRQIMFTALDDQYTPQIAQQQMRLLLDQKKVFAIAGGEGTPNFLAVVPLVKQGKIPAIAPYAPSSEVGTMDTPTIYMTAVNYITEFQIMTQYVIDNYSPNSFALVGVQGNVGDNASQGMKQAIGSKNLPLLYIPENPGTPDFTPIATQLKGSGADWVFLILTNTDTGQLLKAMAKIGYTPKTAAWPGMQEQSYIDEFGDVSQNMIVAQETAALDSTDPLVQQFVKDFTAQTGKAPTKFDELGWAQAELTVQALKLAPALTRDCVMAALNSLNGFETGIYPPITFGPQERQGVKAVGLVQIQGKKVVPLAPFVSVK